MAKNLGEFTSASVSEIIKCADQRTHVFTVVATNVVSTVNVRIEYSYDDVTYYNVTDYDYEITEDDTYNLIVTKNLPVTFLRFRYVSGTGDLQVKYLNY